MLALSFKQVRKVGEQLTSGLTRLERKFAGKISNARGVGSMQAVDVRDAKLLTKLTTGLRDAGRPNRGSS